MCVLVQLLYILGESKLNKVLNTRDFVLDDNTSDQFNSEIDYMDNNLSTNLMNLQIMKQKHNFLHTTKMSYVYFCKYFSLFL